MTPRYLVSLLSLSATMRGQCCICTDGFELDSDISALQCGHTFHATCLRQWMEHSRTCPHCRNKINAKSIVPKLFFDVADERGNESEDVSSIRNQLSEVRAQLRVKDKEKGDLQTRLDDNTQQLDTVIKNLRYD